MGVAACSRHAKICGAAPRRRFEAFRSLSKGFSYVFAPRRAAKIRRGAKICATPLRGACENLEFVACRFTNSAPHGLGCLSRPLGERGSEAGEACAGVADWPRNVIPARYYLYSFQDIPAGPSIFPSIFRHNVEYMDTDSPSRCVQSSKIAKNSTEPPKVAPKQTENGLC